MTRPPMPIAERKAPVMSIDRSPLYGTSRMPRLPRRTTAMMSASTRNPTRHDRRVVTKPPIRGPIAAAIAPDAPTSANTFASLPFEVAVDQRLHRREIERGAQPAEDRPEDDDRRQALREHHCERPDGVEHHAYNERALAPEQITDLAADEDERSGYQRLNSHRRLDPAHRRVEVVDDRRDRHVHERRVDHEHEHRGRQKDALPGNTARAQAGSTPSTAATVPLMAALRRGARGTTTGTPREVLIDPAASISASSTESHPVLRLVGAHGDEDEDGDRCVTGRGG